MQTQTTAKKVRKPVPHKKLRMYYRAVYNTQFEGLSGIRSQMCIISKKLGKIEQHDYMPIAEKTAKCVELCKFAVAQACRDIIIFDKNKLEYDWVSVYIPLKFLSQKNFKAFVEQTLKQYNIESARLCFELNCDVLNSQSQTIQDNMEDLRMLGCRFVLTEFGAPYCDLLMLDEFKFDFAMLDEIVAVKLTGTEFEKANAILVLETAKMHGIEIIASGVNNKVVEAAFVEQNCYNLMGRIYGGYDPQVED